MNKEVYIITLSSRYGLEVIGIFEDKQEATKARDRVGEFASLSKMPINKVCLSASSALPFSNESGKPLCFDRAQDLNKERELAAQATTPSTKEKN